MNELCFVWGPPLSGQWRWLSHVANETEDTALTELLCLEDPSPDGALEPVFDRLMERLKALRSSNKKRHVYCELPWRVTDEGFLLEDFLEEHAEFFSEGKWNLSFIGLCPRDAQRLPEKYRKGLEEFSRASASSIIVPRSEAASAIPSWLGTEILDFGSRVEVFDEPVWQAGPETEKGQHYFSGVETFEFMSLPLHRTPDFYQTLMREFQEGRHGAIWGAELSWMSADRVFHVLTLTQGQMLHWTSVHPSFSEVAPVNGAALCVAGFPLRKTELMKSIRADFYC